MFLKFYRHFLNKSLGFMKKKKKTMKKPCKVIQKLDPLLIKKYDNQLVKPSVFKPFIIKKHRKKGICKKVYYYFISIREFKQQVLPKGFPKTKVWGYCGLIKNSKCFIPKYFKSSPGSTFDVIRGIPVKIKWRNKLKKKHPFPVDPTLHWANPNHMPMEPSKPWPSFPPGFKKAQKPVPVVTHLHGGEVPSVYDGHPEAWFASCKSHGPEYKTSLYTYPNEQQPATLWYHDHTLGITRLNVYAGLSGFYLLRDKEENGNEAFFHKKNMILPSGKYEIPIVIQDRMFNTDGSLLFQNSGDNPEVHPYWMPEFFGDTILVNGRVWPNLDVERRQYRFRILNGSNARFYNLKLNNHMNFIQIGSDGGFLPEPVKLTALLLAPGERADILIDFSELEPGTAILMTNDARAPYPDGSSPDPNTVGQIMRFRVPLNVPLPVKPPKLPKQLNRIPDLRPDTPHRILTLNEVEGENGPIAVLLDGLKWSEPITETPIVGSTEVWTIVNLTMDTHPIHLHLVQFLVLNRQNIYIDEYKKKWEKINGTPPLDRAPVTLPVDPFLSSCPIAPDANETGWKDTVRMNPGQVTRILVRFAPQNVSEYGVRPGENLYSFNPTDGPGYVWHCHILDHEDNEMMRPYKVKRL